MLREGWLTLALFFFVFRHRLNLILGKASIKRRQIGKPLLSVC